MEATVGYIDVLNSADAGGDWCCTVFFQGCKRRCPGCQNPDLLPFTGGQTVSTDEIMWLIRKAKNTGMVKAVAFAGGEPLEQPESLKRLLAETKALGLDRWLYTGYDLKDTPAEIKNACSVIVAGWYDDTKKTGGFPASANQQVWRGTQ